MKREHRWNKEDAIIALFYAKFGTKGLLVTDEKELAESVIGSSFDSLKMMILNYNHLMGLDNKLDHVSDFQREAFEENSKISFDEFKDKVNDIILKKDLSKNKKEFIAAKKERDAKLAAKKAAKKRQDELDEIFRSMGKDPKKMRKI